MKIYNVLYAFILINGSNIDRPGVPQNLTAVSEKTHEILVYWAPPLNENGELTYKVSWNSENITDSGYHDGIREPAYRVINLTACATYEIKVSAIDKNNICALS